MVKFEFFTQPKTLYIHFLFLYGTLPAGALTGVGVDSVNTGASILTRAASVDNFSCVIQFLVETGCKVTENVINWIKVRNPDCTKMCETSLRMPHSLLIQSRAKIWSILRTASSEDSSLSYCQRTDILVKKEELPLILSEYIQCIT